jgi:hypothetical protein
MLNSLVLETAIGMVFVYLIFSLIASAIAEYLSAYFDRRGDHLRHILFNLFDNDDPRGRTFLKLFVTHPMIQALNSTEWKPEFQSAVERFKEGEERFEAGRNKWAMASNTVSAADNARDKANAAEAAAKAATDAASNLKDARKTNTGVSDAMELAIATATAALAAAKAATDAKTDADIAGQQMTTTLKAKGVVPVVASEAPSASQPALVAPPQQPAAPKSTVTTPPDTSDPGDRATKAAAEATRAAKVARAAADAADKTSRGLGKEFINSVSVPKYIPDGTFVNVLINVLTSGGTIDALKKDGAPPAPGASPATSLWARFSAALQVVRGIASRLPATLNESRKQIDDALRALEKALASASAGVAEGSAVVRDLESGINALRGAVATVPSDPLRAELLREIDQSLRPLHALGQNILLLQNAGAAIAHMADSSVKTALSAFIGQAGEDLDAFKHSITGWYNDVMDHASGWYKRNTQYILIWIAAVLCLLNNVDTISLVKHLSTDPKLRESARQAAVDLDKQNASPLAGIANAAAPDPVKLKADLDKSGLPLWWSRDEWSGLLFQADERNADAKAGAKAESRHVFAPNWWPLVAKLVGLALSIMAVSMGAPFWFDILNKLVNVRLVGRKPDPVSPAAPAASPTTPAGA